MSEDITKNAETQPFLGFLARNQIGDTVNLPKDGGEKIQSLKFSEKPEIGTLFALRNDVYRVTKAPKNYDKDHEWKDSSVWVKQVKPSKKQRPFSLDELPLHEDTQKFLGIP